MKIKTFWLVLLKIIGIFLVLKGVSTVILSLNSIFMINSYDGLIWEVLITIILVIVIYFLILWLFVFKTSWLVEKLRLEKGFEEEKIELNTQLSNLIPIAIIVIGGIILINSLPNLCKEISTFLQSKYAWKHSPATGWIILYTVETLIGCLFITKSKQLTAFINRHSLSGNKADNQQND